MFALFKRKPKVIPGVRYCPDCGKKVDITDTSASTGERVWCRYCKRYVWITRRWNEETFTGPMTTERVEAFQNLRAGELKEEARIRSAEKKILIGEKFCTFCGTTITHTCKDVFNMGIESHLECPFCSDIRFYEDVVEVI